MTYDLKLLNDNRDALLLAEVAAWLHDMGKCADEHIINQASDKPIGYKYDYKTAHFHFLASAPRLNLLSESIPLRELVEKARPKIADDPSHLWLLRTLGRCHGAAHVEKEEADSSGKQLQADTRLSDTFGFEREPLKGLTARLTSLPFNLLQNRPVFEGKVREAFLIAAGETRRPENEVTLWDWSHIVAALYKAALAGALLGYQPQPNDLRWRLLSVRVDSAMFLDNATRLPDLLVRQRLLADSFERVRKLLEEDYPLATRVYQDENANIYVVPNLSDLLSATDSTDHTRQTLKQLILTEFTEGTVKADNRLALSGEVIPEIKLDTTEWQAQRPDRTFDVPPIARIVSADLSTHADANIVADWWQNTSADVCPVCGLRPQGPGDKAKARKVCDVCERRRADRAEAWAKALSTTIWTDEVADVNGRLALIVGQFDLDDWLNGKMVQTLTVTDPEKDTDADKKNVVKKNPSFARLRRVWETTRTFWQEILLTDLDKAIRATLIGQTISESHTRLDIRGTLLPQKPGDTLGYYHTYELVVNRVRVSVVWDSAHQRFITCDNLDYLAKPEQIGRSVEQTIRESKTITIEEPTGYGAKNQTWGTITVEQVTMLSDPYMPAIPILAEPRTFMALVPADRALEVVQAIKAKYECEMGKVRNRLPLTLGAVYFGRRTPLAAALEAGRRMLKAKVNSEQWTVNSDPTVVGGVCMVTLETGGRKVTVRVSTVMGDGSEDKWYPYWRVASKPTRTRWFVGPDDEHWVHVSELRQGDNVHFTPSAFDFEYLDTTARRFEVSYEHGQRRGADKRQRPYLLEEVEQIEQAWKEISRLPTSQIKALDALIEAKRRDWGEPRGAVVSETFHQFVRDVLKEADVHTDFLERAAVSGMLSDALELHLMIAKEKEEEK